MSAPICKPCQKRSYTEATIFGAAINTARTIEQPVRHYECPAQPGIYHLTKRLQKAGKS